MNSMTGFGRGTASGLGLDLSVELSSVNRRSLDISVSMPKEWQSLERPLVEQLRGALNRGSVRAVVQIARLPGSDQLAWDERLVNQTLDKIHELAQSRGVTPSLDFDTILKVAILHRKESNQADTDEVAPLLQQAAQAAVGEFTRMRAAEGAALAADMTQRGERLGALVANIQELSAATVPNYRELLMNRLRQAGLELELQDERVLKEIAIFADRVDTSEELTRLASHLDQFVSTVKSPGDEPTGRKLEFILQEINREFNTIGSKANNIAVSKAVIEAKNEIERLREQVQNVE